MNATHSFAEAAHGGMGAALLFALSAGLLTALTPCVYPMIPITISIFGARTETSRRRSMTLATLYVAGIATMFGTLGTVFALLGRAFGTFLASPWFVVPICVTFLALAASMFGAFELALPASLQQRLSRVGGRGHAGAFLMGLVGGVIAAPCTGPPLAGMLAYVATTRDGVTGFLLLATYATGIGVPFWLIAGFSMQLPKSGRWMESVKSLFGIALLVAALYYLKGVLPGLARFTTPRPVFAIAAVGVVALGIALGAVHLTFHGAWRQRWRKTGGIALCVVGLFALSNFVLTPKVQLPWLTSEANALEAARASQRPMVVDFAADWCLPCKEMELGVFANESVGRHLEDFVLLRIDVSNEDSDPAVARLKEKYAVATLPAVRVVSPRGDLLARTDTLLTAPAFIALLESSVRPAAR